MREHLETQCFGSLSLARRLANIPVGRNPRGITSGTQPQFPPAPSTNARRRNPRSLPSGWGQRPNQYDHDARIPRGNGLGSPPTDSRQPRWCVTTLTRSASGHSRSHDVEPKSRSAVTLGPSPPARSLTWRLRRAPMTDVAALGLFHLDGACGLSSTSTTRQSSRISLRIGPRGQQSATLVRDHLEAQCFGSRSQPRLLGNVPVGRNPPSITSATQFDFPPAPSTIARRRNPRWFPSGSCRRPRQYHHGAENPRGGPFGSHPAGSSRPRSCVTTFERSA